MATDIPCQALLLSTDPIRPYHAGRPFTLKTNAISSFTPLFLDTVEAHLFVAPLPSGSTFLIVGFSPSDKPFPSNPFSALGTSPAEAPLHFLGSVNFKCEAHHLKHRFTASVTLPITSTFEEKHPWLLPLLIPRRLPATLRTVHSKHLSLWVRLR